MKKYVLIFGLFIILTFFTGCYTVLWSPDQEMPTAETYQEEYYYDNGYYADPYYGSYGYYYQYPWWLSITPPVTGGSAQSERGQSMERIRDRDGSRSTDSGNRVLTTPPVTTRGTSGSNTSTTPKNDPPTRTATKKTTDTNSSGSSTSSGSTSGDSGRSSDSGKSNDNGRNNDGGRNNGGRR
ncbi:MAG: hypothetical protein R6W90_11270 [Ignavibacteriaceae bacterium]